MLTAILDAAKAAQHALHYSSSTLGSDSCTGLWLDPTPCFAWHQDTRSKSTHLSEDSLVGRALLHSAADLVEILRPSQLIVAMRVQKSEVAVQLAPVIPGQLSADTVQCYVEGAPVSLHGATQHSWNETVKTVAVKQMPQPVLHVNLELCTPIHATLHRMCTQDVNKLSRTVW